MSIFGNLSTEGHEETTDRLGGGFSAQETDAYTGKIKAFYAGTAQSGAKNVTVIVAMPYGELRETIYVTNKEGKNYYMTGEKKDKKASLPGFITADEICMVTAGKPLSEVVFEDKVMNIYDPNEKKELPKSVPMAVELIGKDITLGVVKQVVDKTEKNANGEYVPTGETREENTIEKVFHYPSNVTVVEAREAQKANKTPEAVFFPKWVEKNKGVTRDKTSKAAAANGGKSGRPTGSAPKAGETQTERKSLFGN